jgi:hypothetical protein
MLCPFKFEMENREDFGSNLQIHHIQLYDMRKSRIP